MIRAQGALPIRIVGAVIITWYSQIGAMLWEKTNKSLILDLWLGF